LPDAARNISINLIDEKTSKIKEIETPGCIRKPENLIAKHNGKNEIENENYLTFN